MGTFGLQQRSQRPEKRAHQTSSVPMPKIASNWRHRIRQPNVKSTEFPVLAGSK
jgi:hypothetical protein